MVLKNIVIDTNAIFMSLYNPNGKAGKVLELASEEKLQLFSPDSVKIELERVLKRELKFDEKKTKENIAKLPINWIEKDLYIHLLDKTKVKHKPDKPIEAVSLLLNCGILSADEHFKGINKIDIDKLIEETEKE